MADCFDVAKYILNKTGEVTAMKLQKLVYYTQAWALVWDERRLFHEKIEAWVNGPVVPSLYSAHTGKYQLSECDIPTGDAKNLTANEKDTVDQVLKYYGDKSSKWLSDLTHMEDPWIKARRNLSPSERGSHEITLASMAEYYSSITLEESVDA